VEEGLAAEHDAELVRHALEQLLDGRRVANERHRHLEAARRNVAVRRLHVVGDPLDKVARVLRLHRLHLVLDLLHRHLAAEVRRHRQVAAVLGVRGGHHVLAVEHLRRQLRHRHGAVLLAAARREGRKADHEEVQARERH
jgi:hypothetical protein